MGRAALLAVGMALAGERDALAQATAPVTAPGAATAPAAPAAQDRLARLADIELRISVDRDVAGAQAALDAVLAEPGVTEALATDAALAAQVARVRVLLDANRADDTQLFEQTVRDALARNDQATLDSFGARAAPIYERLVLDRVRIGSEKEAVAPLVQLMQADPRRGLQLLRRQLDSGHPLSAYLTLLACNAYLNREGAWILVPGRVPQLTAPELTGVLTDSLRTAGVITERETSNILESTFKQIARVDQFTPELVAAFLACIGKDDANLAERLLANSSGYRKRTLQPFYEAMVVRPSVKVRQRAASALQNFPESPGLRSRAHDDDVLVRQYLAQSLGMHPFQVASWPERSLNASTTNQTLVPVLDEAARAAIAALAQDPDPGVRELLVRSLATHGEKISSDLWERLVADPDPGVRAQVAEQLVRENKALQTRLLVQLAGDAEAPVIAALRTRLQNHVDWQEGGAEFIPVLHALHENRADPSGRGISLGSIDSGQNGPLNSPDVRLELTRWTLRDGDVEPLKLVRWFIDSDKSSDLMEQRIGTWLALQPDELAKVFVLLEAMDPARFPYQLVNQLVKAREELARPAMEAVLADPEASVTAKLRAYAVLFGRSEGTVDPGLADRLVAFVSGPAFRAWQSGPGTASDAGASFMKDLGLRIPASARNAILLRVLHDAPEAGNRIWTLLSTYVPALPGGADITQQVLQRWFDPTETTEGSKTTLVGKAIDAVADTPEQVVPGQLMLAVKNVQYAPEAVRAMGKLRDPAYLPTLAECLRADWFSGSDYLHGVSRQVSYEAISALGNYASTEAARILLGAAAGLPDRRDACLQTAETIRKYQDAVAEWDRRAAAGDSRADAVAKLVALLKDPDAATRAAAVSGLATLHAVEQLPAIIALLKDGDASVREAARDTLTRLQSAAATAADAPR